MLDARARVVHVLLTADVGGLERVAIDLARKSDAQRFDCRVVCTRTAGALASTAGELGVRLEALGARGWIDGVLRLARRLRQLRTDIVHTHNPGAHRVGVPARLLSRTPVLVHTKHGRNQPNDPRAVRLNRTLARFSDAVVAVSHDSARVALEIERVPGVKVHVIHNGVELSDPLASSAWDSWRPSAITVARLDPVKDQATMLRAVRRVIDAQPDFRLLIVGDGPERPSLEALAREQGMSAAVSFAGYQPNVQEFLRRPQVFLLSSVSEGVSLTLLEAMMTGLPAIVTDVGGNREVVDDGVSGLLAPPREPERFANQILKLVRDGDMARSFGASGRSRVEKLFDLRVSVARYGRLYESLLTRR